MLSYNFLYIQLCEHIKQPLEVFSFLLYSLYR